MIVEEMAAHLQLPKTYVERVANTASHRYKSYTVRKKDGKLRSIDHPAKELKVLQRWLARRLLSRFPLHSAAIAYRPGVNGIRRNAEIHAPFHHLLRLDLESFFPSIAEADAIAFFEAQSVVKLEGNDVATIASLMFRHGSLVIGAPSSPLLSNLLCWDLDHSLSGEATRVGAVYTRYADDLFFSAAKREVLVGIEKRVPAILAQLQLPANLTLNIGKTRYASRAGRRRVTGLVLGSQSEVSLGRPLKRRLRSAVFAVRTLPTEERRWLAGMLAHAKSVEPDFINKLYRRYKTLVDIARSLD